MKTKMVVITWSEDDTYGTGAECAGTERMMVVKVKRRPTARMVRLTGLESGIFVWICEESRGFRMVSGQWP